VVKQNEMWRQLARNVKISLGLLNVHLCFAVGRNIYDYEGKTVLAVRQFLSLHSPRCTVGLRAKVIISHKRKATCRKILHRAIILRIAIALSLQRYFQYLDQHLNQPQNEEKILIWPFSAYLQCKFHKSITKNSGTVLFDYIKKLKLKRYSSCWAPKYRCFLSSKTLCVDVSIN